MQKVLNLKPFSNNNPTSQIVSIAPKGLLNLTFVLVYLYLPSFPCIYPSLYLCRSFFLYITPTVFRLVSLYELLLYLNFRIVLERVKQKGTI